LKIFSNLCGFRFSHKCSQMPQTSMSHRTLIVSFAPIMNLIKLSQMFFFMCITFNVCFWLLALHLAITYVSRTQMGHVNHFRHLRSKRFQWYKELFDVMGFDPCNRSLKIRESIGTPTPKVGVHLGVCDFIPSHFPTLLKAWNVIPEFHSRPTPSQALALVASQKLGLQHEIWTC